MICVLRNVNVVDYAMFRARRSYQVLKHMLNNYKAVTSVYLFVAAVMETTEVTFNNKLIVYRLKMGIFFKSTGSFHIFFCSNKTWLKTMQQLHRYYLILY